MRFIELNEDPLAKIVYFTHAVINESNYYICMNKTSLYCFEEPIGGGQIEKKFPIEYEIDYLNINKIIKFERK